MTGTHEDLIKDASGPQLIFDSSKDEEETDESEESLSPTVSNEDMTVIKGIGSANAIILNKAGITSIEQLSNLTVEELSKVNRIGLVSARKMIEGAKSHLETLNLDNFSQSEIPPTHILQEEEEEEEEFEDYKQIEDNPIVDNENKSIKPWFDSKYKKGPTGVWLEPPSRRPQSSIEKPIIQEYEEVDNVHEVHEVELEEDLPKDIEVPSLVEPEVSITHDLENVNRAVLNHQEIQSLSKKICTFLEKKWVSRYSRVSRITRSLSRN